MRELRKNAMRMAAARGSEPAAAVCKAVHCCCTSGGQVVARAFNWANDRMQGLRVSPFGGDPPQFQQRSWVVRLCDENLLQQLLEFSFSAGVALALYFLREQVHGAQIAGVDLDCFAEFGDRLRRIAALAFEYT